MNPYPKLFGNCKKLVIPNASMPDFVSLGTKASKGTSALSHNTEGET